jgi:O-antigen/teichoic acid export membrane protein
MRTKLSLYNTISAIFQQIINLVVNFILQKVMITIYGSAINGLVSSIRQIISYLNLVEAGLSGAAVYALYKPLANKDKDEINGILSASNRFYNITGFIFSALVLATTFIYPMLKSEQGISALTIAALVVIIGASGSLEFFAVGKYKVLYTADQKNYIISLINAIALAINAVIIIILASLHINIVIVQLIALISFFVRSALYVMYGKLKYSQINFKVPPRNEALDKRWDALFLQILGVATNATPIIVISLVLGYKEVSVFTVYNMVFASVLALLITFSGGLSAMFGELLAKNELGILQKAYQQYEYLYYGLLAWGYACAAILIIPFMEIYTRTFKDAVYIRPGIAALFVAVGVLSNVKTPQGMLVISAGLYKETKIQSLIQAIIIVVTSSALAPFLGMEGVLVGAVLSHLYRDIDLLFYIPKTVTKLKASISIRRVLRLIVLFSVAVFPVIYFIDIKPGNLFNWALCAIPTAIWAFIIVAGGNIIIERKMAAEVYIRIKGLYMKKLEGGKRES